MAAGYFGEQGSCFAKKAAHLKMGGRQVTCGVKARR